MRKRDEIQAEIYKVKHTDALKPQVVKPGIYARIDWFTVIFEDCSVKEALSSLSAEIPVSDDFDRVYNERFYASQGYLPEVVFNFSGICVKVGFDDVRATMAKVGLDAEYTSIDSEDFFGLTFRKIRCDISGSGLNELRARGIDVDTLFFRPLPLWNDKSRYHVTRCDFAFDLIDYKPAFLDKCIELCREFGNPDTLRIPVSPTGGIKFSVRTGDQKTLYLGAATSDRLLRIYDKALQFRTSKAVSPYVLEDGSLPESWIRIELQTRRQEMCSSALYSVSDFDDSIKCFERVFRFIFDKFGVYVHGEVAQVWKDLFSWGEIGSLLQKSYFVQSPEPVFGRSLRWLRSSAFKAICVCVAEMGWKSFQDLINEQFRSLQLSNIACDRLRFNSLMVSILDNRASLPEFIYNDGRLYHIGTQI